MRRQPGRIPAAVAFGYPCRDRLGVGPRQPAQDGRLAGELLIEFAFRGTLEQAGHFSQQVSPAARQVAQRGGCGAFLVLSELAPPGPEPGLAGQLRDEDPVSLRALLDHAFEYRTGSRVKPGRPEVTN